MRRVLRQDGFVILTCPDLQAIGARLSAGDLDTALYTSRSGPVSPLDMLYGFRPSMKQGNLSMAHHTGFTLKSLAEACTRTGFAKFLGLHRPRRYDLWGLATKARIPDEAIRELGKIDLRPI